MYNDWVLLWPSQTSKKLKFRSEFSIALLAGLLFIPFLGGVHLFDWDEINFAECAREMYINRDFGRVYIQFLPFWEKPPFFIWLQLASMKIFGISDFAARFPNAICGIISLIFVYRLGKRYYDSRFGWLWVFTYAGSVLPHLYFHSGIIDPWFNLLIFIGLHYFFRYFQVRTTGQIDGNPLLLAGLSGLFLGIALITKGPAALLIFGLVVGIRWILLRFRLFFKIQDLAVFFAGLSLFSLGWGLFETLRNGPWFITEFIRYNIRLFSTPDAGHGGFPGYHVVVLLFGCFPASFFFLGDLFRGGYRRDDAGEFRLWMHLLFWVVLILFSIIKTKIVHYSSLCYFPLTFGAAMTLHRILTENRKIPTWIVVPVGFVSVILALALFAFPQITAHPEWIRPLLEKDPFAVANLETQISWQGWEWLTGIWVLAVFLVFLYFQYQKSLWASIQVLFGGTALSVVFILWGYIGRIEAFSQGTIINFFESLQGQDAYILTYGYRSYAHVYYPRIQPDQGPRLRNPDLFSESMDHWRDSLLRNPTAKPVYVVSKINKKEGLEQYPELKLQWEKSGWSVWKKEAGR